MFKFVKKNPHNKLVMVFFNGVLIFSQILSGTERVQIFYILRPKYSIIESFGNICTLQNLYRHNRENNMEAHFTVDKSLVLCVVLCTWRTFSEKLREQMSNSLCNFCQTDVDHELRMFFWGHCWSSKNRFPSKVILYTDSLFCCRSNIFLVFVLIN